MSGGAEGTRRSGDEYREEIGVRVKRGKKVGKQD